METVKKTNADIFIEIVNDSQECKSIIAKCWFRFAGKMKFNFFIKLFLVQFKQISHKRSFYDIMPARQESVALVMIGDLIDCEVKPEEIMDVLRKFPESRAMEKTIRTKYDEAIK